MAEARKLIPISAEWIAKRIKERKDILLKNAQINGDLDLEKLDIPKLHAKYNIIYSFIFIENSEFNGVVKFPECFFNTFICFNNVIFNEDAMFEGSVFNSNIEFNNVKFGDTAWFSRAIFNKSAKFTNAIFSGQTYFEGIIFNDWAFFDKATFSNLASFIGSTFCSYVVFSDAVFRHSAKFIDSVFDEGAIFCGAKFEVELLTFKNAIFKQAEVQEEACRKAKNVLEKNGNREEAGYHFYREMEAKRKQKESDYRYFDYEALLVCNEPDLAPRELKDLKKYLIYNILDYLFIQVIFGYGVNPRRLWGFWWFIVFLFALLYWTGGGINDSTSTQSLNILDYLWFSITVAVTPGFAGYKPTPGIFQIVAGLEAIFGTFMWAAFITTFAKKYMR